MRYLILPDPRHPVTWASVTLVLALFSFPMRAGAQDMGDPDAGRRLAEAWCSNCHVVGGEKTANSTGAPTFRAIAANRAITPLALRAFFVSPHDRMPDLHLSYNEMDDLIAYIVSLR